MNFRKQLPDRDELLKYFSFDFEKGKIERRLDSRGNFYCGSAEHMGTHGYMLICHNTKQYFSHRVLWKVCYNEEPPMIIDHIDEDKTNNSITNLRACDRGVNKVRSSSVINITGYRGVFSRKDRKKCEVRVSFSKEHRDFYGKKDVSVGYFHSFEEAACAYNMALDILGYKNNFKNIVDFDPEKVNTNFKFFKTQWGVLSQESMLSIHKN
jgi:hypothetical protein